MVTSTANPPQIAQLTQLSRPGLLTTLRRQPLAAIGFALLALFLVLAFFAPLLSPFNPSAIDLLHRLAPPDRHHWVGTDELGRDVLSRLIWGARLSLTVAISVVSLSLAAGLILGGLAGFYGR